jgi:microcystin degradation protein MlrC
VDWPLPRQPDETATFAAARIGVLLVQQESNSFAIGTATLDEYTILDGPTADLQLAGANSEFPGACAEVRRRGGVAVPLLYAHALPAGPLDDDAFARLRSLAIDAVSGSTTVSGGLDGLIVCLHGALATVSQPAGDAALLRAIRHEVGARTPIALTLDLHANATPDLIGQVDVVTGYRTNPHVDLADTGRRGAALLAAAMSGAIAPTIAVATCPAIFPDQALRTPAGTLGRVLADVALQDVATRGPFVDVSVFPTQPWLDAPGIGFTAVVTADADAGAADALARAITRAVWERRHDFVAERLLPVDEVLAAAERATVRPFVISEAADAPTAGTAGDGTGMLGPLARWGSSRSAAVTIVDPAGVAACHAGGIGATLALPVGASIDPRWEPPVDLEGTVTAVGDGDHALTGVGYHGMVVSMGRFAVLRCGRTIVLLTERPAWSADPGAWRHAGIEPDDVDVLVVRSNTDYLANFPASAPTSVVADVPGAATPRLARLTFGRCGVVPYPVDPDAVY